MQCAQRKRAAQGVVRAVANSRLEWQAALSLAAICMSAQNPRFDYQKGVTVRSSVGPFGEICAKLKKSKEGGAEPRMTSGQMVCTATVCIIQCRLTGQTIVSNTARAMVDAGTAADAVEHEAHERCSTNREARGTASTVTHDSRTTHQRTAAIGKVQCRTVNMDTGTATCMAPRARPQRGGDPDAAPCPRTAGSCGGSRPGHILGEGHPDQQGEPRAHVTAVKHLMHKLVPAYRIGGKPYYRQVKMVLAAEWRDLETDAIIPGQFTGEVRITVDTLGPISTRPPGRTYTRTCMRTSINTRPTRTRTHTLSHEHDWRRWSSSAPGR